MECMRLDYETVSGAAAGGPDACDGPGSEEGGPPMVGRTPSDWRRSSLSGVRHGSSRVISKRVDLVPPSTSHRANHSSSSRTTTLTTNCKGPQPFAMLCFREARIPGRAHTHLHQPHQAGRAYRIALLAPKRRLLHRVVVIYSAIINLIRFGKTTPLLHVDDEPGTSYARKKVNTL